MGTEKIKRMEKYLVLHSITTSGAGTFEQGQMIDAARYEKIAQHSPELTKFFEKQVVSKEMGGGTTITKKSKKSSS